MNEKPPVGPREIRIPDRRSTPRHTPERRAFPRWPADLDVRYGQGENRAAGHSFEISAEGMRFSGPRSYPLGAELDLEFRVGPGETDVIQPRAAVRYSDGEVLGVEFVKIRISDRLRIIEVFTKPEIA